MKGRFQPSQMENQFKHCKAKDQRGKEEDDKSEVKILGLNRDTMSDELRFEFVSVMEYLKSLLKLSAKLFDPLGLLSPFVVNMKIWFQKL